MKGLAIVGADNSNGTWQYTLNGTDWFNIGSVSASNALLLAADATTAFRFVPNANWNGTTGLLQYKAWDQTSGTAGTYVDASVSGGTTAFSGTSGSTVQVTAVNDAPVLGFTGSITIPPTNEDTPSPPCPVSDLLFSAMRTDVDAGALSGIAVTAATGKGVFQYSTDGVTWTNFGTVSASNALLLTNTTQVRYQPDGKNGETGPFPQFTFIAWDRTSGSASANGSPQYANPGTGGGTSAYSSQNATAMIWVDSVNDAPAGTDKTIVAAQNTPYTFTLADCGFTDPVDSPAHSLSAVKITTLPGSGSLTLNGAAVAAGDLVSAADITAGKLIYTPAAGANGAGLAAFTFQVKDSGGTANGGVDLDPTPNTMTIDVAGIRIVAVSPQVAVGDEVRVNTTTAGVQRVNSTAPQAVARDAAGNTVVVWTSADQDGSFDGVYAQRYDAAGNAVGAEFRVNTTTIQTQSLAAVAMAPNGDFVITWSDASADGGAYGVYAQRYNAAGVAQDGEFRVNSTTANNQYYSSVAMDAAGNFVIVWESFNQDGSGYGIYGQRYNAAGVAEGGEFQVNTTTSGDQITASVAVDAAGNFVITWVSVGQDGSGTGVYGQRYNAAGVAQGGEFLVNTTTSRQPDVFLGGHEQRRRFCGHLVEHGPGRQRHGRLRPAVQCRQRGPGRRDRGQHHLVRLAEQQRCGGGQPRQFRHHLVVGPAGRQWFHRGRSAIFG